MSSSSSSWQQYRPDAWGAFLRNRPDTHFFRPCSYNRGARDRHHPDRHVLLLQSSDVPLKSGSRSLSISAYVGESGARRPPAVGSGIVLGGFRNATTRGRLLTPQRKTSTWARPEGHLGVSRHRLRAAPSWNHRPRARLAKRQRFLRRLPGRARAMTYR